MLRLCNSLHYARGVVVILSLLAPNKNPTAPKEGYAPTAPSRSRAPSLTHLTRKARPPLASQAAYRVPTAAAQSRSFIEPFVDEMSAPAVANPKHWLHGLCKRARRFPPSPHRAMLPAHMPSLPSFSAASAGFVPGPHGHHRT